MNGISKAMKKDIIRKKKFKNFRNKKDKFAKQYC